MKSRHCNKTPTKYLCAMETTNETDTPQRRRPLIERSPRSHLDETELKRPREKRERFIAFHRPCTSSRDPRATRAKYHTTFSDAQGENRCTLHNNKHESVSRCVRGLKFLSLNVCGRRSKQLCPEFYSFLCKYDIVGLQETKTDDYDD
ncbi:hypothetical protein DPMN_070041 [Dreissena polymorpha]|uniref:Endonuclease/exonuclease/phosphatase domain-containing protein n=1 Tax=Dreissena polymorpha TaxID=45954 RepID=A0A9D4BUU6_DREPO|nr:hypothetical protein DPMN_070041 [Dreissena polymorpha]